jgi:hypothetical protein
MADQNAAAADVLGGIGLFSATRFAVITMAVKHSKYKYKTAGEILHARTRPGAPGLSQSVGGVWNTQCCNTQYIVALATGCTD